MARELYRRPEDLPRSGAINYILDRREGKLYPPFLRTRWSFAAEGSLSSLYS